MVQTVANDLPLLLHLPGGVDRNEVMGLIGEFPYCFIRLGVCY
jgi:hypothetical protein